MNILTRLGFAYDSFKRASFENPSTSFLEAITGGDSSSSGVTVNTTSTLGISSVWNAVQQESQDIATLTPKVYQKTKEGREERKEHRVLDLLKEPNETMSGFTFLETYIFHYLIRGNGLAYHKKSRNGKAELILANPDAEGTQVRISKSGRKFFNIEGFDKRTWENVPDHSVTHIPNLCFDGYWGIDPITNFKNTIGLALSQEDYNNEFYKNDAGLSGILETPNPLKDGDGDKYRGEWRRIYGAGDKHNIAVMGGGMSYKPISISPEQSQFLQSREFSVVEVARMFNIPTHKIKSMSASTNNNIEHQSKEYYQDTLQPIVTKLETELSRKLLTEDEKKQGFFIQFDMDEFARADIKTRFEAYQVATTTQTLTRNEIRAEMGRPPLADSEPDFVDFQTPATNANTE